MSSSFHVSAPPKLIALQKTRETTLIFAIAPTTTDRYLHHRIRRQPRGHCPALHDRSVDRNRYRSLNCRCSYHRHTHPSVAPAHPSAAAYPSAAAEPCPSAQVAPSEQGAPSAAYNIGTGTPQSVRAVIDTVSKVVGQPVQWEAAPRRPGDPAQLYAASDRAQRELNWTPRFADLEVIVRHAWQWHSTHPRGYRVSDTR